MMIARATRPVLFLLLTITLTLTACRKNQNQPNDYQPTEPRPSSNAQPAAQSKSVTIYKYRFNPNSLTLPVGSTVTFSNKDPDVHNVSIRQLNVDRNLKANESFSYTFNQRGTFTVTNRIANAPMQATITIQ